MYEESSRNKHNRRASKNKRAKCGIGKNKHAQALAPEM